MQHKILIPEYLQSSETFTPNNIVVTGSPTINSSGVMSNLSNSDYVSVPTNFAANGNWECVICVKPYSTKTAQSSWTSMDDACVLGIPNGYYGWVDPIVYTKQPNVGIFVTTNGVLITINKSTYSGDSTNVGSILRTDITFSNSSFYDIKVEFTGSAYNAYYKLHSANSWTSLGTISSSNTIGECALNVGYTYQGITGTGWIGVREAYFNGQIDLFNSYIKINGNYFWMNKNIIQSGLVPQPHSVDTMKYLKKTTTSTAWTQPILSANGTLGGNSFAVVDTADSSYDLWKAFDGDDNTYGICGTGTSTWIWYNPNPIKISQFSYKFGAYGKNWNVYGSNDNSTWTQITVSQNPNSTEGTVILTGDSGYKYHKIVFQQGAAYGLMVYFIKITATTGSESWSAGTSSNYTIKKPQCHSVNVPKYLKQTATTVFNQIGTPVGSPSIIGGILSSPTTSNYLSVPQVKTGTLSSLQVITKVRHTGSFSSYYEGIFVCETSEPFYSIGTYGGKVIAHNGGGYSTSSESVLLENNKWYWLQFVGNATECKAYVLEDNGYTLETLPPLSNWTLSRTVTNSSYKLNYGSFNKVGTFTTYQAYGWTYWRGDIDLFNTKIIADGVEQNWKKTEYLYQAGTSSNYDLIK